MKKKSLKTSLEVIWAYTIVQKQAWNFERFLENKETLGSNFNTSVYAIAYIEDTKSIFYNLFATFY